MSGRQEKRVSGEQEKVSGVHNPSFRRTASECRGHEVNVESTRSACKKSRIRVSGDRNCTVRRKGKK